MKMLIGFALLIVCSIKLPAVTGQENEAYKTAVLAILEGRSARGVSFCPAAEAQFRWHKDKIMVKSCFDQNGARYLFVAEVDPNLNRIDSIVYRPVYQ